MPRQCSICVDPARAEFEAAVGAGSTVKAAALALGLPTPAAFRHARLHGRLGTSRGRHKLSVVESWTPVDTFSRASGHEPMTWQREILTESRDTLLVKGRQIGATEVASALAIHTARTKAGSTSAVISPSLRQSSEVTFRARLGLWALGETLRQDSTSLLRLANGSRIVSLPGSARGIRGYVCDLVVLDEAAWIMAETFTAARPLTAATNGRLVVQSTPGSPVGPFYNLVMAPPAGWAFLKVRSDEVPTIDPAFLERERREMAPELYRQEYEATFAEYVSVGALFTPDQIAGLILEETS